MRAALIACVFALLACGDEDDFNALPDAPVFPDTPGDSDGMMDADGMLPDAMLPDGLVPDSGVTPDAGADAPADATPDTATPDTSTPDTSTPDTSTPDTSTPDTPGLDAGTPDTFTPDTPRLDASTPDTFTPDTPRIDASTPDTFEEPDAPRLDAGTDTFEPDAPEDSGGDPDSGGGDPDSARPDAGAPDGNPGLIPACPIDTWCAEPSLNGVFAVSASDVFAVGADGTILHRTNRRWTAQASHTTSDLTAVWGASATDVWAVGRNGTIRRFDGSTWRVHASGTTADLHAIWGSSANDVWIAGAGRVLHWNGRVFTTRLLPGTLLAVHGTGPNDVWVTGENALVAHFFHGTWTTEIHPGTGTTYLSIRALGDHDVLVGGLQPTRETLQFTGTSWVSRPAPGCVFQGLFSTSTTRAWGVGGTRVGRWNGTTWTVESPAGPGAQLWDVTGTGRQVWVVGSDSLILHRN